LTKTYLHQKHSEVLFPEITCRIAHRIKATLKFLIEFAVFVDISIIKVLNPSFW